MGLGDVKAAEDRLTLVLSDYTEWFPDQPEGQSAGRLILGNPPYTRWQLIPHEMRSRLAEETADLCGRRASLSAYITAVTLQSLRAQDGLCLLLPAQWLESDYARGMRRHLLERRDRRVELWLVKSGMFKDATVDAVVLLVGTKRKDEQSFAVAEWPGGTPNLIDRSAAGDHGWRGWFDEPASGTTSRYTLADVATVRRGVATGANQFFVLADEDVRAHSLPPSCLRPVVQRLLQYRDVIDETSFDAVEANEAKWLFSTKPRKNLAVAIAQYIKWGEDRGYDERHLCSARKFWFDLEHDIQVPDVIITAMSRGVFRVVTNDLGAAITNNLYGWKWRDSTSQAVRAKVVEWLRTSDGQQALRSASRRQGNNLLKLEPRALSRLPVPETLLG